MRIEYSKQAVKALGRIDSTTKQRIKTAIEKLPVGDIKSLKGYISSYRLRVGDWRVLFEMSIEEIKIDAILPRGEAYKK
ncbi:MAG: type II toxin-antitoxin system RelE/ParE family toxin [Oscillospiraceae bacterium]|nr:type II toxin-antitoxin system RelE/ParE family toxin [Oscillospiraceae bacterium]